MGMWGVYDDEGDVACDYWCFFVKYLAKDEHVENRDKYIKTYMEEDPEEFYEKLQDYFKFDNDSVVPGVCLKILKAFNQINNQDALALAFAKSELPNELPKDFPEVLRNNIVTIIENSMENILKEGWRDPINRRKALNHELYIFSNGEKGNDGSNKFVQNGFAKDV